ncbi:hypothetical protein KKC91_11855 [bacterium]|nr:hypothetical protein [bacterium]
MNDDSAGMTTSTGAKGYERESNYYYSPIGIEVVNEMNNGWFIGITLEYDHFWKGRQISHIGDAIAGVGNLENDQNEGYGLRGSVEFEKKSEKMDFLVSPFIRYWDIEQSETQPVTYSGVIVGYGYEPENSSIEYGVKFTARL